MLAMYSSKGSEASISVNFIHYMIIRKEKVKCGCVINEYFKYESEGSWQVSGSGPDRLRLIREGLPSHRPKFQRACRSEVHLP